MYEEQVRLYFIKINTRKTQEELNMAAEDLWVKYIGGTNAVAAASAPAPAPV